MPTPDLDKQAATIRAEAEAYGLTVRAADGIVTVSGSFTPGDRDAYVTMESNAYVILAQFRYTRPGSVWGTDSGSVGGHIGMEKGYVRLNKSGVDKRLAKKFEGQ